MRRMVPNIGCDVIAPDTIATRYTAAEQSIFIGQADGHAIKQFTKYSKGAPSRPLEPYHQTHAVRRQSRCCPVSIGWYGLPIQNSRVMVPPARWVIESDSGVRETASPDLPAGPAVRQIRGR